MFLQGEMRDGISDKNAWINIRLRNAWDLEQM